MRKLIIVTASAVAIAATAPGTAFAMPVIDPQPRPVVPPERVTVVREVPADQTLALVVSGSPRLVAGGAAGYSSRSARSRRTASSADNRGRSACAGGGVGDRQPRLVAREGFVHRRGRWAGSMHV